MWGKDRVFVIAEAGVNHNGSLEMALRLVDAAANSGADAVKFQTFRADRLTTTRAAKAHYQQLQTGADETQGAMLRSLELSLEAHVSLVERCSARGIRFMSTAFDRESLDFIAALPIPAVKIPSGDITAGPLLLSAARKGHPILMSTGMATLGEIEKALAVLAFGLARAGDPESWDEIEQAWLSASGQAALAENVVLLHCVTAYPTPPEDVNLQAMTTMNEAFHLPVGYSDHTLGTEVALAAVARGAVVIEKHITLDRALPGPDHAASLEPEEFTALVRGIRIVTSSLGSASKSPTPVECGNRQAARRSLVAASHIPAGKTMEAADLDFKRPGDGISPMHFWDYVGRPASRAFSPDEVIS